MSAIGCPSKTETTGVEVVDVDSAKPRAKGKRKAKAASAEPWNKVMASAPPLDIPPKVSPRERAQLEAVGARFQSKYEAVRVVWEQTPACDPSASSCHDWRTVAADAEKMYRALDSFSVGSCGEANGTTASVHARSAAHGRYLNAVVARLEAHLEKLAVEHGPSGSEAYAAMLKKAKEPPPRPCLSPCPMPELQDITVSVPFAERSSSLEDGDTAAVQRALQSALATQRANGAKATLIVRGHADPSEPNGDEVAKGRARKVAEWLIQNGVPGADVIIRSLGSTLPIERSGTSGAVANRRVDFEVVPR